MMRLSLALSIAGLATFACGDEPELPGEDAATSVDAAASADAAVSTDAARGDGGGGVADASAPDAASPVCASTTIADCRSELDCVPGCAGLCDCTCPGPPMYEGCGCTGCEEDCFVFGACLSTAGLTPCGPAGLYCDTATEICVSNTAFIVTYECTEIPKACADDRSCDCVSDTVCIAPFSFCTDLPAKNSVDCQCLVCA